VTQAATQTLARLTLEVVSGPQRGARLVVQGPNLVLGRTEAGAAFFESDPLVSHRHAIVRRTPAGDWTIEDAGSKNGTFVNDQRVVEPATLKVADQLRLGDTTLKVASLGTDETMLAERVHSPSPGPDSHRETPPDDPDAVHRELKAAFSQAWRVMRNSL
jgi:pSer/pThr/pTyr-binding forkhead associated (FHA) protein